MNVRAATVADIDLLISFQESMALETENIVLDPGILRLGIQNLFGDSSKGKYYVAEDGGVVMGCLMTTYEWSDWRNGNVLWIQSVYIDRKFRGQQVYRKMYEHIQGLVQRNSQLRGIRLYVDRTNINAQEVYRKLGMNGEHYQVFEWMKPTSS